jgi:hypothetical protein
MNPTIEIPLWIWILFSIFLITKSIEGILEIDLYKKKREIEKLKKELLQ